VRYHPAPLTETPRGILHLEFDLAIALPLACLKAGLVHGFAGTFILITSGLAFGQSPSWGSYSIVKRGQVIMAEYLSAELAGRGVRTKAIALGSLPQVPRATLAEVARRAIEDKDPGTTLYKAYGPVWERFNSAP
jgi:NAD(P)-dependent dehydrogenase (short-subunit alcohol dehydrogenase family)